MSGHIQRGGLFLDTLDISPRYFLERTNTRTMFLQFNVPKYNPHILYLNLTFERKTPVSQRISEVLLPTHDTQISATRRLTLSFVKYSSFTATNLRNKSHVSGYIHIQNHLSKITIQSLDPLTCKGSDKNPTLNPGVPSKIIQSHRESACFIPNWIGRNSFFCLYIYIYIVLLFLRKISCTTSNIL